MQRLKGDNQCHETQQGQTPRVLQQKDSQRLSPQVQNQRKKEGNAHCHGKAGEKQAARLTRTSEGELFRSKAGDRSLNPGGSQRYAEYVGGKNHLINTDSFRTNQRYQEYFVIEANDSAGQSGGSKQQCASDQRMPVFFHFYPHVF